MCKLALLGGNQVRSTPYLPWPEYDKRDVDAVTEVIYSRQWGGFPYPGPQTEKFLERFLSIQGGNYAVTAANGTITLEVACRAANIGWGDEVIVPAYTFQATAAAPMSAGAIPIFVDIDADTYCINADAIEAAITERTKAIIVLNTLLNYVLIFGKFGFPALGVKGAALATLTARIIEVIVLIATVYVRKYPVASKFYELTDITSEYALKFFKIVVPILANEFLWTIGISLYKVVYGRIGTNALVATNISSTVESFAFVIFTGMANACAIIIGKEIGADNKENAQQYSKKILTIGAIMGVLVGIILVAAIPVILMAFNISKETSSEIRTIFYVLALFMPIKVFNMITVIGILRSGGDTKYGILVDTAGVWIIGVPLGFMSAFIWKLPLAGVYALICMEELFRFTLGLRRFVSKKWMNNLTQESA